MEFSYDNCNFLVSNEKTKLPPEVRKCGKPRRKETKWKTATRKTESKCNWNYNMVSLPVWQQDQRIFMFLDFVFSPTLQVQAGEVEVDMMRFFFLQSRGVRNKQSSVLLCK